MSINTGNTQERGGRMEVTKGGAGRMADNNEIREGGKRIMGAMQGGGERVRRMISSLDFWGLDWGDFSQTDVSQTNVSTLLEEELCFTFFFQLFAQKKYSAFFNR
jgi:hypothetical protein